MKNTNVGFIRFGNSKPLSREKEILKRREKNQFFHKQEKIPSEKFAIIAEMRVQAFVIRIQYPSLL